MPTGLGLIVDFLNTLDLRRYGDAPYPSARDELSSGKALAEWADGRGPLNRDAFTDEDAELVRRFREELRAVVEAGRERLSGRRELGTSIPLYLGFSPDGTPVLDARDSGGAGVVGKMLAEIHAAGATGTWARLKVCASQDCRRAFYDASRNCMGRWCSMNRCGNRAKTRAYRRRLSAAAFPSASASPSSSVRGRPRGAAPPRRGRANAFGREGDYWSVSYAGTTFRLKDAKGLHYMARLLAEPGREWHVLDLVGVVESSGAERTSEPPLGGGERMHASGGMYEPVLDARARAAYERRIEDLMEAVHEGQRWGDSEREAGAREEIEAISGELARATGLGGRDRPLGSDAERARVNVTRVIKAVLTRIDGYCPELRHHFASTLKTGIFCSYNPDPRLRTSWQL